MHVPDPSWPPQRGGKVPLWGIQGVNMKNVMHCMYNPDKNLTRFGKILISDDR